MHIGFHAKSESGWTKRCSEEVGGFGFWVKKKTQSRQNGVGVCARVLSVTRMKAVRTSGMSGGRVIPTYWRIRHTRPDVADVHPYSPNPAGPLFGNPSRRGR